MDTPILTDDVVGVTDFAKRELVNDAKLRTVREYTLVMGVRRKATRHTVTGNLLSVWADYDRVAEYRELWVTVRGESHLVHRKPDSTVGFTPFAREHLLYPTGHARDIKRRTYVMGGKDSVGKRSRREMKATLLVVWLDYAGRPDLTHLWVKWKDGKRHLVHRKAG